jgi:hypothetical protein
VVAVVVGLIFLCMFVWPCLWHVEEGREGREGAGQGAFAFAGMDLESLVGSGKQEEADKRRHHPSHGSRRGRHWRSSLRAWRVCEWAAAWRESLVRRRRQGQRIGGLLLYLQAFPPLRIYSYQALASPSPLTSASLSSSSFNSATLAVM